MIGKWLDRISPAAEDAILETQMVPWQWTAQGRGCLVSVAARSMGSRASDMICPEDPFKQIAARWNQLCQRFAGIGVRQRLAYCGWPAGDSGAAQAAALVRNRILSN